MLASAKGIRPFLGAKDFDVSRAFYRELGFREVVIDPEMSAIVNVIVQTTLIRRITQPAMS